MSASHPHLLVTGAAGQLGSLVIDHLLGSVPAGAVAALVRRGESEAAARLQALGVALRVADYAHADTLEDAFAGIERALFISSNSFEGRIAQHRNVVEAAGRAGTALAYTSVLHADASPLGLAADHRETEAMLRASGLPFVILRNGWYTENYMAGIPAALAHDMLIGSAGQGRIASAGRDDYALAGATVLTAKDDWDGRIFELAGDDSYTLAELAAELSRQAGRTIGYRDLPEAAFKAALLGAGLPAALADLLADSDAGAAKGALFDAGRQLSALTDRPTLPLATSVAAALARR